MLNNDKHSSSNARNDRDESLKRLLASLEDDPRYADQARTATKEYESHIDDTAGYSSTYTPSSANAGVVASGDPSSAYNVQGAVSPNWDLSQCTGWTPMSFLGAPMGVVVWNPHPPKLDEATARCAFCNEGQTSNDDPLFQPCQCKLCHRSCFKQWRLGWINPRNFYQCRDCMYNYKIERIAPDEYQSPAEVRRTIRCKIGQLWIAIVLTIAAACSLVATIAWAADRDNKNVPVFVKSLLTSVAYGFPNSNSTALWRDEFHNPAVHVFQYYGLLGAFVVSIIILILSCLSRTTESERSGKGCCDQCYCNGDNGGSSNMCFWCCFWNSTSTTHGGGGGSGGGGDCGDCNCGNCNCLDCSGGGCDCKLGDMGEAAAIVIVVVIVVVLVSAIFVAVLYAVRKSAQLHDSVATLIRKQQEELENATVVFGKDEFVRPLDRV